jgi:UDP-N-acetylglucosamine 2-epimerase (non-hydrolysing)
MKRLEGAGLRSDDQRVRFMKPMGFFDYVKLQMGAYCVLSDSGTITEESSILNFPAVTLREAHERPEGMDEGTLIMCGIEADTVVQAVDVVRRQFSPDRPFRLVPDYEADNVSRKVVRLILSYTDYVNRTVWRR